MLKKCVICGKEFETRVGAKTCNEECSVELRRKYFRKYFREYQREYRKNNPEKVREYKREYRKNNPEKVRENNRRFYKKNHQRFLEKHRRWYSKNGLISPQTQKFFLSLKLGESVNQQKQKHNMQNKIQNTPQVPTVAQFIESFLQRLKGIEDSCKELALMVDANPNVFDEIIAADARFNRNMLESMRKVGKGELYCELLFDPSLAARKLLTLPVAQQRKLYNEPIKVVRNIAGKNTIEERPLNKLSRHELNLVIDEENGRARTVEEQLAYVAPPAQSRRAERYEIVGDRLRILAETEFSMSQLEDILERMKTKALKSLATKK